MASEPSKKPTDDSRRIILAVGILGIALALLVCGAIGLMLTKNLPAAIDRPKPVREATGW